ncbi:Cerato-platanin [Lactifluus volemus]|nr:Cerato-platanin [Lactifluus volemus]
MFYTPPPAITARVTFDTTFDNRDGSMNNVACSNGVNGLASRFPTFGSVPSFPFIGGAFDVVFNSTNCGGCWSLTNPTTGTTINLVAIDTAGAGFNIAKEAFEVLTNGQIGAGAIDVVAHKVSPSVCEL